VLIQLWRLANGVEYEKQNSFSAKFDQILADIARRHTPGPNDHVDVAAQAQGFRTMLETWNGVGNGN
jgi:hypothetical protein